MDANESPTVLIVEPDMAFEVLDAVLSTIGWQRDMRALALAPLRPGEPELAGWVWPRGRHSITYTFNPVARLRVLDLSSAAPKLRLRTLEAVPHSSPGQLMALLEDADPRRRLLAVLAIGELELGSAAAGVARLAQDPERAVAAAAAQVAAALARREQARRDTLATLGVVYEAVRPLLAALGSAEGAACAAELRPKPEDYGAIFREDLGSAVASAYDELWRNPPRIRVEPDVRIDIFGAPAGMLRSPNELSRPFPGGYRAIALCLRPERVWLCWRYVAPGAERGSLHDGLVQLDGRWVWCPKPYRVVGEILRARGELVE